jgi:hypothetical protein
MRTLRRFGSHGFESDDCFPRGQVVLYTQTANEPAHVSKLVSLLDKTSGQVTKKKPRAIPKGSRSVDGRAHPQLGAHAEHCCCFAALLLLQRCDRGDHAATGLSGALPRLPRARSVLSLFMFSPLPCPHWLFPLPVVSPGRFSLRRGVETVAVGVVTRLSASEEE